MFTAFILFLGLPGIWYLMGGVAGIVRHYRLIQGRSNPEEKPSKEVLDALAHSIWLTWISITGMLACALWIMLVNSKP